MLRREQRHQLDSGGLREDLARAPPRSVHPSLIGNQPDTLSLELFELSGLQIVNPELHGRCRKHEIGEAQETEKEVTHN